MDPLLASYVKVDLVHLYDRPRCETTHGSASHSLAESVLREYKHLLCNSNHVIVTKFSDRNCIIQPVTIILWLVQHTHMRGLAYPLRIYGIHRILGPSWAPS